MSDKEYKRGRGRPVNASPEQVSKHRNRLGLSLQALANELDVTYEEAQAYESGKAEMDEKTKKEFARLKKVTTRKNKKRDKKDEDSITGEVTGFDGSEGTNQSEHTLVADEGVIENVH